jgi:hypothetical protein
VNPQSGLGGDCRANGDCSAGVCSAGTCCNRLCDADCETCDGNGNCQSNGLCDAFDCVAPDPPTVADNIPVDNVFLLGATPPPTASGGTLRDGRYIPARIDLYGELTETGELQNSVTIPTYEFQGRSVQLAETSFFDFSPLSSFLFVDLRFAGTYSTTGTTLTFDVARCDVQFNIALQTPSVGYTATANGLVTISQQGGHTVVVSYLRQ